MKLLIFVVFAMLAAAFAIDTNLGRQGQAAVGWGAGAVGVVGLGAAGKFESIWNLWRSSEPEHSVEQDLTRICYGNSSELQCWLELVVFFMIIYFYCCDPFHKVFCCFNLRTESTVDWIQLQLHLNIIRDWMKIIYVLARIFIQSLTIFRCFLLGNSSNFHPICMHFSSTRFLTGGEQKCWMVFIRFFFIWIKTYKQNHL